MRETTIRIEQSVLVGTEPSRLWSLLSSTAVWSLWPDSAFVFAVPEVQTLRFFIGPIRRGTGAVLFEVCDEVPGSMIRLRTLPTGRQEYTLSVAAARRGTAKATVRVTEMVPRFRSIDFEVKRRSDIKSWLSAMRAVTEGRARWPGTGMPARLRKACMAQPRIIIAQSASASALISADPATVWDAVHSPESARFLGTSPPIYSGYVPGTPQGQAGEMQYFIDRRADGPFTGQVVVVTETADQRSALACRLGLFQFEQHYQLTPESESGPTRLNLTFRWATPETTDAAKTAATQMAESVQAVASGYKSLVETGDGRASAATEP